MSLPLISLITLSIRADKNKFITDGMGLTKDWRNIKWDWRANRDKFQVRHKYNPEFNTKKIEQIEKGQSPIKLNYFNGT